MKVICFETLPQAAKKIREEVFMKEQGFENEFDDLDPISKHLVLYDGEEPIGTCRFFFSPEKGAYVIGRIAIVSKARKKHLGAFLLTQAEREIEKMGGKTVGLSAQQRAQGFYERQGYRPASKIYYDEYCPHLWMEKTL